MGQTLSCCVQREGETKAARDVPAKPEFPASPSGSSSRSGTCRGTERDLRALRDRITALNMVVKEMKAELGHLRVENQTLLQTNGTLQESNRKLRRSLEEQELQQAWRNFDVVEHHYRQLERHRASLVAEAENDDDVPAVPSGASGSDGKPADHADDRPRARSA